MTRSVLVLGSTGVLGRVVVDLLTQAGHPVIAVSRSQERLDALTRGISAGQAALVTTACFDFLDPDATERSLRPLAPSIGAVVVTVGRWQVGDPLATLPLDTWHDLIDSNLTAHLRALQTAHLVLGADGVLVSFNGEAAQLPMAGSGAISAAGAAQSMLLAVAREEGAPYRIVEVRLLGSVLGDDRNIEPERLITREHVGEALEDALAGRSEELVRLSGAAASDLQ